MNNLVNVRNFSGKSRSAVKAVRKTLLITTAIGFYVPSALAQVAVGLPKNLDSDDNSISYSSGLPVISEKILSIGGSQNGLEHVRTITGNRYWIHNYTIAVTGTLGGNVQVIIGSRTINFSYNSSTGKYVNADGGGGVFTAALVYIDDNGDIYNFTQAFTGADIPIPPTTSVVQRNLYDPVGPYVAYCAKVTRADGTTETLYYTTQSVRSASGTVTNSFNFIRLALVAKSTGYSLKFGYATNTLSTSAASQISWSSISSVYGVNNTIDSCSSGGSCVAFTQNWPYASYNVTQSSGVYTEILTTPAGRVETIKSDASGQKIASIQIGSNATNTAALSYDASGKVAGLSKNGVNYTYAFSASGSTLSSVRSASGSTQYTATADIPSGALQTFQNALNQKNTYQYNSSGLLAYVVPPEGVITSGSPTSGYTKYSYDANGNVTEQRSVAKVASGLSDVVQSSGYLSSCSSGVLCDKPSWTKDAKGNETDYTYDSSTGFLTSVTGPADANLSYSPRRVRGLAGVA